MESLRHIPVMLEECMSGLNLKNGGIYFDGTLGGAGHSYEILKRTSPNGKLYATDLDVDSIERAKNKLKPFDGRFSIVNDNFKNYQEVINEFGLDGFDGVLLDFGMSSFQIDDKSRGFSYLADNEPLDMRMDKNSQFSARDVVNGYEERKIVDILQEFGEERFARKIASEIVRQRKIKPIETCGELVKLIDGAIPRKFKLDGHPAKRTFQAIRIEVNQELDNLYETVLGLTRSLKKGGRIAILTFHSLEDRIVKNAFRELEKDCICDKNLPICVCGKKKEINIITKHPIIASQEELSINSRSRSAKLRIAEKI